MGVKTLKGMPKQEGSGRQKGTPNKKSLLVHEILENKGINLIEKITELFQVVSEQEQLKALVQMLPYVYPKLTSTELKGAEGIRVIVEKYIAKPKE